jgi:GST-like protein
MIDLYYATTPNGQKILIMLEEIQAPYRIVPIDIFTGDQLKPEYGRVNPNRKIPAIVDHDPQGGGEPLALFESGAILQYLAAKSGQLCPPTGREHWTTLAWLTWQVASVGPMCGQFSHFSRYAPEGQEYGLARYSKEVDRLFTILDRRLEEHDYVAGPQYTIADIALWPQRQWFEVLGIVERLGKSGDPYPAMTRWYERILARPGVQRAMARPEYHPPARYSGRKQVLSEKEWSNLYGKDMHGAVKS